MSRIDAENRCDSWPATEISVPDVVLAVLAHVQSGQGHATVVRVEEPEQQVRDRRLAGAARTEQRDPVAWLEPEADAVECRSLRARVPRGDAVERNGEWPLR